VAAIVAVADEVGEPAVDEETDARCTNTDDAKWTMIPPKHAGREKQCKR